MKDFGFRKKNSFKLSIIILALVILVISIFVAFNVGIVKVNFFDLILNFFSDEEGPVAIVRDVRGPRIFLAIMVGANLAISGCLMQAVLSNPMAEPGITGVSMGATVVATVILIVKPDLFSFLPIFSFFGGLLSYLLVLTLSWKRGFSTLRLILAGVAVNAFLGGINTTISVLNSDKLPGVLLWTSGSIAFRSWYHVKLLFPYTVVGLLIALLLSKSANLISLGEKNAKSIGVNVDLHRFLLSLTAVYLAGVSVCLTGTIGFVGLIVPHISRFIVGSEHKFLIPMSAITGSILLLLGDTVARTIAPPIELPVGVIMASVGGPFFIILLRKKG